MFLMKTILLMQLVELLKIFQAMEKNMEKGKVIFATVIFSLLMAMAITVLIVKDISYKREKKIFSRNSRKITNIETRKPSCNR